MLEVGLLPRVASASSGFLIFFSTSSDIAHYLIQQTLEPFLGYAIGCFFVAMFGAFTGLFLRDTHYAKEHNYLIVFLLAGLLTSCGLMGIRGFLMSHISWEFGQFCS